MSADSKSPMLNGGTPPKDLEEDVKFTEEDSRRNHVVECWVVLLIVINIVLAVIVIVLAAPTQTDPDPSQCNEWKNNRSASFSELLKQVIQNRTRLQSNSLVGRSLLYGVVNLQDGP